jgi:putative transcriptional regulator
MPDLTVPLPEEYADLLDDWATDNLRKELLRNGLLEAKSEIHGIAEGDLEMSGLLHLRTQIDKLRWLEGELTKMVPANDRLAGLRRAANLDRDELAAKLGVEPNTILFWEAGAREIPQEDRPRIAEFFGVSIEWLMGEEDER